MHKPRVKAIRERAAQSFALGTPGLQIASVIYSDSVALLLQLAQEVRVELGFSEEILSGQGAIVAVGGTGRGELCPFSDLDLLFLLRPRANQEFRTFTTKLVQSCWDAGFALGHAVREPGECIALAQQDAEIATSLVEASHLWGDAGLTANLTRQFWKRVVRARRRQFIDDCLTARTEKWSEFGPTAQELEPDVKSSAGGLRDLHLIRWIGFACCQHRDIDELRRESKLTKTDARAVKNAHDYLTRLRIDLHLQANKAQDKLTRDEQLRIAAARGIEPQGERRPVEVLMREYFQHASELAVITRRFVSLHRPRSLLTTIKDCIASHRAEGVLSVGPERIDVAPRNLPKVCGSLESILQFYRSCVLYDLIPAPRVTEAIRQAVPHLSSEITPAAAALFMDILGSTKPLGTMLRAMFDTGILDLVIPDFSHIRSLMQFNAYHHFTVDEHTIRAVEAATSFEQDDSPVGTAYRTIKHRNLLHLALLLHDIGKGFSRDHSIVGQEIALRIGHRLHLPEHQVELIGLLVHKHLVMWDFAQKRDITDVKQLYSFGQDIGSPDALRMLYVLTVADVTAVGPGTWTNWKQRLLTDLFDRSMVILSGKRYAHHEQERLESIRACVQSELNSTNPPLLQELGVDWLNDQLDGFSANYLTCTPPDIIAADLIRIQSLSNEDIVVVGNWDEPTKTLEYRVITRNPVATTGCFHKMAGVLTAKHLSILSADINTTKAGVVVDSYRVLDPDYAGEPPELRRTEVAEALRAVLLGTVTIESLFKRHRRFGQDGILPQHTNLSTTVRLDTNSSDSRLVIDVFAHDRPGLLYTITRELFDLGLSVDLAKIATYFDQVVDVFYVRESDGSNVQGEERLNQIHQQLVHRLEEFENGGNNDFLQ